MDEPAIEPADEDQPLELHEVEGRTYFVSDATQASSFTRCEGTKDMLKQPPAGKDGKPLPRGHLHVTVQYIVTAVIPTDDKDYPRTYRDARIVSLAILRTAIAKSSAEAEKPSDTDSLVLPTGLELMGLVADPSEVQDS